MGTTTPLLPSDPEQLGPYRLEARLGEGGMGTVYLGAGPDGQRVAVKAIRAEYVRDERFRARFRREVEAARRVARFCTAPVIDADVDAPAPYVVTEYIEGRSLQAALDHGGRLAPSALEAVAVSVASALVAIHAAGIVHRDLKPNNVLLSEVGPRVIDFGVAGAVDFTHGLTGAGRLLGTPAFMAPEQLTTPDGTTGATDVFAWGTLIAYAGTGRLPFQADNLLGLAHQIVNAEPDLEGLDPRLRGLVERALAKRPADRPTARAILAELLGEPADAPADTATLLARGERAVPETMPAWPASVTTPEPSPVPDSDPSPEDGNGDGDGDANADSDGDRNGDRAGNQQQPEQEPEQEPAGPPGGGASPARRFRVRRAVAALGIAAALAGAGGAGALLLLDGTDGLRQVAERAGVLAAGLTAKLGPLAGGTPPASSGPPGPASAGSEVSLSAVPSFVIEDWIAAGSRQDCRPLAPTTIPPESGAAPRRATLGHDAWTLVYDLPNGPGRLASGMPCEDCGRGAIGIAGTTWPVGDPAIPPAGPHERRWSDGSIARYGPVELVEGAGVHHRAILTVTGQGCAYEVWSFVGQEHLVALLDGLRLVDVATAGAPAPVTSLPA